MSSTEAEVIGANHAVRSQGLPSLSLFNYIAMGNPPFENVFTIKHGGFPVSHVSLRG